MKNFQNLFLVAVLIALVAVSCNKEDETVHVTVPIKVYEDIFENAYYITPDSYNEGYLI